MSVPLKHVYIKKVKERKEGRKERWKDKIRKGEEWKKSKLGKDRKGNK